jgi:murein DD-endopeptidase MepM/ murein hydrolase activator NlpD
MGRAITGSVGRWEKGAQNLRADVQAVQELLAEVSQRLGDSHFDPKGIDGEIAKPPKHSNTVAAIEAFQSGFMSTSDGLVEVNGRTWSKLLDAAEEAVHNGSNPNAGGGPFFPFPVLPGANWTQSPRSFGSNRSNGTRAHAGCDLYFPQGTWIYAIADGTVTNGPYPFYAKTFALEVDHGSFLARYGEIQEHTLVRKGDVITAGQKIARVGHLVEITVPSDMLHLELYSKTASGALTVDVAQSKKRADGVPFLRRKDLIDPTARLNEWKTLLPKVY